MQSNNPYVANQNDNRPQIVVGNGAMIAPQPVQSQTAQPVSASTKGQFLGKGGIVKGIFVAAALVLFAAGFASNSGVVALTNSNAKSAGKSMVAALVAGNSAKAYGLASANLRGQQTADALLQSVGNVQTTKADYTDQNVQVNGNTAVYVANVDNLPADNSGKTSGIFVVSMTKTGVNSWKVDDVSVQ